MDIPNDHNDHNDHRDVTKDEAITGSTADLQPNFERVKNILLVLDD